jgi:uncharacterized protein YbjT (DUF2867 family)
MTVLVTGATGNAGSGVVDACLARGLAVRAAVRGARPEGLPAGVEVVPFDFAEPSTWDAALEGVSGIFLLMPPGLGNLQGTILPFIARARDRGAVPLIYMSVQGAETSRVLPHRTIEKALIAGPRDWTILRPGFFAQNLGGPYRRDILEESRILLPSGRAHVAFIDIRDLGDVAAGIFAHPGPHLGQGYALTGQESPTFDDVARILTEELGREIRYEPASVTRYIHHLRKDRGLGWGQALLYTRLHVGLRWGEGDRPTPDLPRLLGRAPRTMRDYVRDHRALWLPGGAQP